MAAGRRAGGRGVLVRTGYGRDEEAGIGSDEPPDRVCDDLPAAVAWLLEGEAAGQRPGSTHSR